MRKIFGLGEIVYDIILKNFRPLSARPGGSVLNALVSLGRKGKDVFMVGEIGNDITGRAILEFLNENRVGHEHIVKTATKSNIALAFLDDKNDASYEFYKSDSVEPFNFSVPLFSKSDILLFGSSLSVSSEARPIVSKILTRAKDAGTLIYYDPNFRSEHSKSKKLVDIVEENLLMADITRGSFEDFFNIFNLTDPDKIFEKVAPLCSNLILTDSSKAVFAFVNGHRIRIDVPQINTLSTVGAGDSFNAGVINKLVEEEVFDLKDLTQNLITSALETGVTFSQAVCKTLDNYIGI
ncbi:MAG: hypothetical protein JXR91_04880 [Deltaproteobacteria bacterium]|nr:hypothetical protein [Deltaproteobacteria bacterium]